MAYYSPTFLSPNSNQEILESTPNEFSWQINGDTSQVAYRLYIRLNSDNSSIYDSTKTTSAVGAHVVPTSTVTAGNRYKWQVWSYYDGTNYTSSDWEIFNAIGLPTITLSATPSTEQTFTFDSRYTHPESIAIKSYKYKLYLGTDLTTAIEDSGDIYPDSLVIDNSVALEYEFEGLVSGTEYGIECIVSTQNDYEITTGIITFTSNYTYPINTNHLTITSLNTIGAIQLDWANLRQVIGVVDGTYEYLDGFSHEDTSESDFNAGTTEYVNVDASGKLTMTTYVSALTWGDYSGSTWSEV